jgi:RHS repeat-associated protein
VNWYSFNMPNQIVSQTSTGLKTTQFWYNTDHERIKELQADGSIVITLSPRYDTGLHFEKKYLAANGKLTGAIEYEHYLYAGGMMFGKFTTTSTTNGVTLAGSNIEYYTKDHLGSIVAITDANGVVTQNLSYDVWGKRRYPNGAADPNGLLNNPDMYHGFTGHEMLDSVGLIHMNGRLYDPVMARFVSADPMIQSPGSLQSYNRYSYVWNNPLAFNDPSGFCVLGCLWQPKNWSPGVRVAVAIAVGVYAAPLSEAIGWTSAAGSMGISNAVASGMLGGAISGAIMGGTVKSALIGGATGGMFGAVGDAWPSGTENVLGHAGVGCASGLMSGSGCGSGAMSAGFSAAATPYINDLGVVGATMASAVIGGTASVLGGGKFENGAQTGAFGYLFNKALHNSDQQNRFFSELDSKLSQMALDVGVERKYIEGLSAFESSYLDDHNRELNNPFGITQAGGRNIQFSSIDSSIDYWKQQYGGQVQGAVSPIDFAQRLEGVLNGNSMAGWHKYNSVNAAWEQNMVKTINSIDYRRNIWIDYLVIQRRRKGE